MNAKALHAYPRGILDPASYAPQRPQSALSFVDEYPDPNPFTSIEEWHRLHHRDLADMDLEQLDTERWKAAMRASYAPSSITPWLRERRLRLDGYAERLRRA